jgi:hypothetical protein
MALTNRKSAVVTKETKRKTRRPIKEKKPEKSDEATIWITFKISFCLWAARFSALVWAYMYHDWQAMLLLVFMFQSFIYTDRKLFIECLTYIYCPYVTILMLWQYVTNIQGVNPYPWPYYDQSLTAFNWGFFQYKIPILEQSMLIIYVFTFCVLLRVLIKDNFKTTFNQNMIKQFLKESTRTCYQLALLLVIYLELPLMLILVFMGLYKNDFYHLSLLFFFIFYMISPNKFNKHINVLLVYANIYICEKYMYTLVADYKSDPGVWWTVSGFWASYDPESETEYFRYTIQWDQWLLVILSFTIYRRVQLIGYGKEAHNIKLITK